MAYSEKTNDYDMVYRANISKWIYAVPIAIMAISAVMLFVLMEEFSEARNSLEWLRFLFTNDIATGFEYLPDIITDIPSLLGLLLVILIAVGFVLLIRNVIYVFSTELYLTQKFTIAKYGFIKRDTIEILNGKVESIRVNQSIIGRILNYGSVIIVGVGGSSSPIRFIDTPLEFRRQLLHLQESNTKGNQK